MRNGGKGSEVRGQGQVDAREKLQAMRSITKTLRAVCLSSPLSLLTLDPDPGPLLPFTQQATDSRACKGAI